MLWNMVEAHMKAHTRRIYACLQTLSEPLCVRWGRSEGPGMTWAWITETGAEHNYSRPYYNRNKVTRPLIG